MKSVWDNKFGTIRVISFTAKGHRQNYCLRERLKEAGYRCRSYRKGRDSEEEDLLKVEDLHAWLEDGWGKDTYLFIGATGIAVRSIAPFVEDKFTDSPVLVMDEQAGFVIPLLSSHIGGAGKLACEISRLYGALPVITTATDLNGKFAVDLFADENGMEITDRILAKEISAWILQGGKIGFYSDFPVEGKIPEEILVKDNLNQVLEEYRGIAVLEKHPNTLKPGVLYLYPKILCVGIGCRRGVPKEKIEKGIRVMLGRGGWETDQIGILSSIDRKADEQGIVEFAGEHGILFSTYTAEELNGIDYEVSSSDFVKRMTGTDNVCERAAILAGSPGKLICKKEILGDITLAVVRMDFQITFGKDGDSFLQCRKEYGKGEEC